MVSSEINNYSAKLLWILFTTLFIMAICSVLITHLLFGTYQFNLENPRHMFVNNVDKSKVFKLKVKASMSSYFTRVGNYSCFRQGTSVQMSKKQQRCCCKPNFFGKDCGIPELIYNSTTAIDRIKYSQRKRKMARNYITTLYI
ncbi:uncharacterized protein LOC111694738 [Eurytemora carolleeae]|uniref:uncharacterized protein LOC111694738 n=1 Tax=Eurytemora carolleeae TaxID=1294199 RepID=UPI000C78E6CA|nr:uncharacterized protein LOC111694738 [Eurytemora carolleeae]|eukprot:XP_023319502.1 uncharacterized protein LOC111694738 [Eurytemora affinis]